jgi:N-acetyl-anhydromuramyl-L-alanine amidase AmpD
MSKALWLLFFFFQLSIFVKSQDTDFEIIRKPINYNSDRKKLSLDYLRDRHNLIQSQPTILPKIIVLHYTGGGTLNSNFNYFNKTTIESGRVYNKNQSSLNVSAHYLIDKNGKIYQLIEDTLFARHTIGLNYCAIGVENIGGDKGPLTSAQVVSNAKLVRYLKKKYPIEYVIGHSEYSKFRKTKWWKETNPNYYTGKSDPGSDFLQKVRAMIKDLHLKYEP